MMALEPRYPSNGGNLLEGSEDLPTYLPGMKHPDPSVTHCKDNSHLSRVLINTDTLLPYDICVSMCKHELTDQQMACQTQCMRSTGPQWEGKMGRGRGRGGGAGGRWITCSLCDHSGFRVSPEGRGLAGSHSGQLRCHSDASPQTTAGNGHTELLESTPCRGPQEQEVTRPLTHTYPHTPTPTRTPTLHTRLYTLA